MSKRRSLADNQSQSPGKRPRPAPKKSLYLVLDDWEKGYSIRKIDPDTFLPACDESSTCTDRNPEHLAEPAAFRFVAPAFDTRFVAMGSNIVIVSSGGGETEAAPTLVYDTEAAALAIGPPLPGRLSDVNVAVAGGGGDAPLYALTTFGEGLPLAFEAFSWAPCTRDAEEPGLPTHEWSWKSVATPPPPFGKDDDTVVSCAVHPDGRTIFVSTRAGAGAAHGNGAGTYSFDTTRRDEWRCHGTWVLPFHGQGYYDRELDAWVGLHEEKGYICACQVASRSGTAATAPPDSDMSEEKLFCKGNEDTHLGATLTSMGNSRFCLAASVALEDDVKMGYACDITTFGLKFNRKGKLQVTSHRTTNSYALSKYVPSFYPVAFWM